MRLLYSLNVKHVPYVEIIDVFHHKGGLFFVEEITAKVDAPVLFALFSHALYRANGADEGREGHGQMGEHGGRGGDGVHDVNLFSIFSYIIQDKREIVNGFNMLNLRILKCTYLSIITDFTIAKLRWPVKNFSKTY